MGNTASNENEVQDKENSDTGFLDALMAYHNPHGVRCLLKSCETAIFLLNLVRFEKPIKQGGTSCDIFYNELKILERAIPFINFDGKKVIILEGLRGAGISSVANQITSYINAEYIAELPSFLKEVAHVFSGMSYPIRRFCSLLTTLNL